MNDAPLVVGLISDTHGLLRPAALAALEGSDAIVHAGDVGDPAILARLAALAPVTAVRGNNDHGGWAASLPETAQVTLGGVGLLVIHDANVLAADAPANGVDVVVCGHSHRPKCEHRGRVLCVNPGSAGPRRFRLPVSVAKLTIEAGRLDVEFVTLDVDATEAKARPAVIAEHR